MRQRWTPRASDLVAQESGNAFVSTGTVSPASSVEYTGRDNDGNTEREC